MTLDLLPAFLMAVLACWLGLSLFVRAPRDRAAQAFAWLCLHLTLYGLSITLDRLSASEIVRLTLRRVELLEIVVLPPVFFGFIMVVAQQHWQRRLQYSVLVLSYIIAVPMGAYALFASDVVLSTPP